MKLFTRVLGMNFGRWECQARTLIKLVCKIYFVCEVLPVALVG